MARVFLNQDPANYLLMAKKSGKEEIQTQELVDFIMQYKDTGVTDFLMCVNGSVLYYDSKVEKDVLQQYMEWEAAGRVPQDMEKESIDINMHKLLVDYHEKNGEIFQDVWIRTLREIGIRSWTSIRMNDIHEASAKEDWILFSDFFREHRAKNIVSHRKPADYHEHGLDYMYPGVRKRFLAVVEEVLERFDTDGIELDWMREIYSIGKGREYEGIAVINQFMEDVSELVKRMEKKRGHAIAVAVRVPDSVERTLRLGFDVLEWVERKWVQHITVTARWASTDNNMPVDVWKRILKGKDVTLAAGLEVLLDAYYRPEREYLYNDCETAIASAYAYLSQGVDGIYLFNYMEEPEGAVKWRKGRDDREYFGADKNLYIGFLKALGDEKQMAEAHRRHVVSFHDVPAIGMPVVKQLPCILSGRQGEPDGYSLLRIPTGPVLKDRQVRIILGMGTEEAFDPRELVVYLNAKPCTYVEETAPHAQQYKDMRYFAYTITHDGDLPPVQAVEMGFSKGKATVHWAEIEILP